MAEKRSELATLGGGCFWCLEAVFEQIEGVERVVSGYSGGDVKNPSYGEVCTGRTGHAEVIQITFDPERISYGEVLEIFFAFHDPTTLDRQGPDVGTQYRSMIFHHSAEQKRVAEETVKRLEAAKLWSDPAVTQIVPYTEFYPAEGYHQGYYRNNPVQPYCQVMISPKIAKLRQKFSARLKPAAPAR